YEKKLVSAIDRYALLRLFSVSGNKVVAILSAIRQRLFSVQHAVLNRGKYSIPQKMNHPLTETRSGDLYFCLEQRLVTIREQPIELTVKEFEIFSLLILNPKRVFTYEMLMELVW